MAPIELDILGRHPMLRMMYTNLSYLFSFTESQNEAEVDRLTSKLKNGLEKLSGAFPWIAGQVGTEITDFETTVVFQTATRLDLSLDTFRDSNWSMKDLDPAVYAPSLTPPGQAPNPADPKPVLMAKAVFIAGGAVVTFSANHAALDMAGQTAMISLLSKACSGAEFTEDDLQQGSRNLLGASNWSLEDSDEDLKAEIDAQLSRPLPAGLPQQMPKLAWAYFQADPASLESLKKKALESAPDFVSTDDALTALVWQSITRARALDPATKSLLARAVDVRRAMNLAETYPGMMQNMAFSNASVGDITASPLGTLAAELRSKLAPQTLERGMRVIMTLMSRRPHESPILAYLRASHDVMVTSWAKMRCYEDDFGLGLGKPEAVFRPRLPAIGQGWVNFMPKSEEKGILFSVCLQEHELEALKGDEEFGQYVKWL